MENSLDECAIPHWCSEHVSEMEHCCQKWHIAKSGWIHRLSRGLLCFTCKVKKEKNHATKERKKWDAYFPRQCAIRKQHDTVTSDLYHTYWSIYVYALNGNMSKMTMKVGSCGISLYASLTVYISNKKIVTLNVTSPIFDHVKIVLYGLYLTVTCFLSVVEKRFLLVEYRG